MAEREKLIEVKDLQISFGKGRKKFVAVDHVNFDIYKGETFSLVGESGSGKTTLLNILASLDRPTSGEVLLEGKNIVHLTEKEISAFRRKNLGFVFQDFNLFPQYDVLQNLTLAPSLLKMGTKEELEVGAKEIIKKVGLEDRINHYPCQLSGGQKQRVAIARALMLKPDILCFDEPTSALDPELTGEVLKVIKSLKTGNSTMIVVTHEMDFAKNVSDKVIFMADGVIEEYGEPKQLFENPKSDKLKAFLNNALDV